MSNAHVSIQQSIAQSEKNSRELQETGLPGFLNVPFATTAILTENSCYFSRFKTTRAITVKKVAFVVGTEKTGNVDVGILSAEGEVLHSIGATAGKLTGTGLKVVEGLTWELAADTVYYGGLGASSAPTLATGTVSTTGGAEIFGTGWGKALFGKVAAFPIGTVGEKLVWVTTSLCPVLAFRES